MKMKMWHRNVRHAGFGIMYLFCLTDNATIAKHRFISYSVN